MDRVYHTWEKWECYPAGFYESNAPKLLDDSDCERLYMELLSDTRKFSAALAGVITDWPNSCEHYLTNERMNRIAWLGQAALTYTHKIPSRYRGGYNLLTDQQKKAADEMALEYLNKWRFLQGYGPLTMQEAQPKTQVDLY
jgi:hypothetical protein